MKLNEEEMSFDDWLNIAAGITYFFAGVVILYFGLSPLIPVIKPEQETYQNVTASEPIESTTSSYPGYSIGVSSSGKMGMYPSGGIGLGIDHHGNMSVGYGF